MHPETNFRSRSGAATKWHETIQNMSFRPKVVDWACLLKKQEIVDLAYSLRQNKKWFQRHKLMHLMHPILNFRMGQVRQRNGVKPPETRVLDIKYVVRNQTDVVEHRNGVKLPQI